MNSCPDDYDGFVYIAEEVIAADGKKGGGHVATPHPSKKDGTTKQQTLKSGGAYPCKSCNRYFSVFSLLTLLLFDGIVSIYLALAGHSARKMVCSLIQRQNTVMGNEVHSNALCGDW